MAKKKQKKESASVEEARQSRKDVLRARKQEEQMRVIRRGVMLVVGLLLAVFVVAVVSELIIAPNRAVATINDKKITLREWQERVRFERAQRIASLENQLELFGGDVGFLQQISRQTLIELQDAESLGEAALDLMIEEEIVRRAAEERGIEVSEEDVDREIGALFNYYDGKSPTPAPPPTETPVPTPSLTPIPTAVITEVVPTEVPPPTQVPQPTVVPPTPTPVSEESFRQQFDDLLSQLKSLGASEEAYRAAIRGQLYRELLMEALAEEENLPTEEEQVSLFIISYDTEEEANEALERIRESDYLTVWNTIRSRPEEPDAESPDTGFATELLWRTRDSLESVLGEEVANEAFILPPNVPSDVIVVQGGGEPRYLIIMVSGREVRELPESELQARKEQLLLDFVEREQVGNLNIDQFWRSRVPTSPVLDPKFLAPPTPAPPPAGGEGDTGN